MNKYKVIKPVPKEPSNGAKVDSKNTTENENQNETEKEADNNPDSNSTL